MLIYIVLVTSLLTFRSSHPEVFVTALNFANFSTLLSANPIKWSNTLKQLVGNLPTNCLSVFDHFVGLALKGLRTPFSSSSSAVMSVTVGFKRCLTIINPLSANFTKWSNTQTIRRQQPTNCLSVFDHFVGSAFKGPNTSRTNEN